MSEELKNTAVVNDDFEFGDQPEPITIEVRGVKREYLLHDISADESDKIFVPIVDGTEEEKRTAQRAFRNRIIAAVVSRPDGSRFSIEDAGKLRAPVASALAAKAVAYLNPPESEQKNA